METWTKLGFLGVFDFFFLTKKLIAMKLTNTMEEKWKFLLAIKREFESIIWSDRSRPRCSHFAVKPDRIGLVQAAFKVGLKLPTSHFHC